MSSKTKVERTNAESGEVYLRAGATIALFIGKPVHEISAELVKLLRYYVDQIPPDTLKWVVASATEEEWKRVTSQTLNRLEKALEPQAARKRKLTSFRLTDAGPDAPHYGFRLVGQPRDEDWPDAVTLVQIVLPEFFVEPKHVERCVELATNLVEICPPTSGYCSPGLQYSDLHAEEAFAEIRALASRFPGYDVQVNDMTHVHIDKRVRGARWITILGPDLVKKLGGDSKLRKELPAPIVVSNVGPSVIIRAGVTPELGDVNRKLDTPLLKKVAKVLEPVTLFEELDMLSYFANFDEDTLKRWERRFLS